MLVFYGMFCFLFILIRLIYRYRARVKEVHNDKKTYTVIFVDYGNEESLPLARIRPLPHAYSLSVLPAQAQEARLALLSVPSRLDDEEIQISTQCDFELILCNFDNPVDSMYISLKPRCGHDLKSRHYHLDKGFD